MLVSQLALVIRFNFAQTAEAAREASTALRTADRFIWLRDLSARQHAEYSGDAPAPDRLVDGIVFEGVPFDYPGTGRTVLRDLDLHADTTVAIVGDNGAGKTTLDGTDLTEIDETPWRRRLSPLRHESVGFVPVPRTGRNFVLRSG